MKLKKKKPRKGGGKPYRAAATITVRDPGGMTASGARNVAAWMRRQAGFLEKHRADLTTGSRFRARYLYAA